ncbi:TPA: hypothetical protein ACQWGQ_001741 [Neisseria subflava]|jgi:putative cytoplasmic protein|uniref:hypothetical protein n=1 Tax=unclassified Neisseria TaxID=2623750 RepID=UPI002064A67A|nr:MAG TPA: cysteine peptidase [Caudoviricetes sp.]
MNNHQIYLALYKGRRDGTGWRVWAARFTDGLTRVLTRGRYSHCEIAVREHTQASVYTCYSASIRDGGVRCKVMPLPSANWDLIPLPDSVDGRLKTLWSRTQGQGYDLLGAFGVIFGLPENRRRWFCSEWVGAALGLPESWRFSPNDLAAIFKGDCHV